MIYMYKDIKQDFKEIPFSGKLYQINTDGVVIDINNNVLPNSLSGINEKTVELYWIHGYNHYKLSELLAFTFIPVRLPLVHWKELIVIFKDNNNLNLSLDNLVWKFPIGGIECKDRPGFFYIPNYSDYVINKLGEVFQHNTNRKHHGSPHVSGYLYYMLASDVRKPNTVRSSTNVGRHRALALTFLNYPSNFNFCDINHKNGIAGDDRIENLEWVTRSENILHAFKNGLRQDNKPVIVHNFVSGETSKYFSAHECERALGLKRGYLHYWVKGKGYGKVFDSKYLIKYETESNNEKKKQIKVSLIDNVTGFEYIFESIIKCCEYLKISKKVIQKRLLSSEKFLYKNYTVTKLLT